jgi:hypothetical protein
MRCRKRRRLQPYLQLNIIRGIGRITEIRQRNRVILRASAGGAEKRTEGIKSHHPRANRSSEILGSKRTKGDVFPFLDITGRPVIHEDEAKEVVVGFGHYQRATEGVGSASDEGTDFEFEVEEAAGTVDGAFFLCCFCWGVGGWVGGLGKGE